MEYTLAYSDSVKGWTSFYSYIPEIMIGMNSHMYSFKKGELYKHSSNETRNLFYDTNYPSTITAVINDSPSEVKNFKTLSLESNAPWTATMNTDLETGDIDKTLFSLKEGDYFGYIRNNVNNLSSRASQGLGNVDFVLVSSPSISILTFPFKISSMVSVGDFVYNAQSGEPVYAGYITAINNNDITINTTSSLGSILDGNYVMYGRNSVAESSGLRGYYMQYTLENNLGSFVELFGIGCSLFKSYP